MAMAMMRLRKGVGEPGDEAREGREGWMSTRGPRGL